MKRKAIARAARRSRTVFGGLAALAASIGAFCNEAVGVALDAASQLTMLAPIASVCTALGIDTRNAMFGLAVGGIGLALFARLDDAAKGHNTR